MSIEEIEALAEKFGEKIDGVPLNIKWWANLVNKAYEQGRAEAEKEYNAQLEKWEAEHTNALYRAEMKGRADAIDEVIKTLAKDEDTILSDRQYYTLMELKEQK